jgi:uncharacterized Rmd1/YagE family protein
MVWDKKTRVNYEEPLINKIRRLEHFEKTGEFMDPKDKKKKDKPFRIKKKLSRRQMRDNYILVFFIRNNLTIAVRKEKIENDMIHIKELDKYYMATADYIFRYEKFPAIMIQEWNAEPINPTMLARKAIDDRTSAVHDKFVVTAAKLAVVPTKKKFSMGLIWIIVGVIALLVIFSLVFGKKG